MPDHKLILHCAVWGNNARRLILCVCQLEKKQKPENYSLLIMIEKNNGFAMISLCQKFVHGGDTSHSTHVNLNNPPYRSNFIQLLSDQKCYYLTDSKPFHWLSFLCPVTECLYFPPFSSIEIWMCLLDKNWNCTSTDRRPLGKALHCPMVTKWKIRQCTYDLQNNFYYDI